MIFDNPSYDTKSQNDSIKVYIGMVTAVDSEKQLMSVSIPGRGEVSGIPISNTASINGCGFRYCPIPRISQVVIYDNGGILYHIGYIYNPKTSDGSRLGLSNYTNSSTGDKDLTGNKYLQRNLGYGESSISGPGGSEIYFSSDGSIIILNSSYGKIDFNSTINSLLTSLSSAYEEYTNMVIRSGSVLRKTNGVAKSIEQYFNTPSGVMSISEVPSVSNCESISEFSIDIGLSVSDTTGSFDDTSTPNTIRFSVADIVIDESGDPVVQDGSFLNFLMDSYKSNIRLSIDEDGSFKITDTTLDKDTIDQVIFSSGSDAFFRTKIGNCSISVDKSECIIDTGKASLMCTSSGLVKVTNSVTTFGINSDGSYYIHVGYDSSGQNDPKYSISISADGSKVEFKNSDGKDPVKAALGEMLVNFLDSYVIDHVHESAMGTTAPAESANKQLLRSIWVKDDMLSSSLYNN